MTITLDPGTLELAEREELRQAAGVFRRHTSANKETRLRFLDDQEDVVTVPRRVADLIAEILAQLAAGRVVVAYPMHAELTTQQAADFLNVSRPYLVKLLDEGVIPHHKVGTHRRVYFEDVLAYRARQEEESRSALNELARLSEELGLYDEP
ncbi:MAG: excisionase [Acidimicrobiia bacterium]|nr:MAG: excisionase [Acidimicrobiia bacterium]